MERFFSDYVKSSSLNFVLKNKSLDQNDFLKHKQANINVKSRRLLYL